jgi:3-hydroxybutyryl-CoA dehydrogenase
MQVIVLASDIQKAELAMNNGEDIIWIEDEQEFLQYSSADAYLDLKYRNTPQRNALLMQLLPRPVIINSVTDTLQEINASFIRINGWTTFLSSPVIEAACHNEAARNKAEETFSFFNKQLEWLPDDPGFIAARVVSMIINEAYIALAEGVSTKEEINTAMKLGTAYPYGPFEWAEKIGMQNIVTLLQKLSRTQPRYTPAELLVQEINRAI